MFRTMRAGFSSEVTNTNYANDAREIKKGPDVLSGPVKDGLCLKSIGQDAPSLTLRR
jgi:hypothetical protein